MSASRALRTMMPKCFSSFRVLSPRRHGPRAELWPDSELSSCVPRPVNRSDPSSTQPSQPSRNVLHGARLSFMCQQPPLHTTFSDIDVELPWLYFIALNTVWYRSWKLWGRLWWTKKKESEEWRNPPGPKWMQTHVYNILMQVFQWWICADSLFWTPYNVGLFWLRNLRILWARRSHAPGLSAVDLHRPQAKYIAPEFHCEPWGHQWGSGLWIYWVRLISAHFRDVVDFECGLYPPRCVAGANTGYRSPSPSTYPKFRFHFSVLDGGAERFIDWRGVCVVRNRFTNASSTDAALTNPRCCVSPLIWYLPPFQSLFSHLTLSAIPFNLNLHI
jgi:hypothetical protein